MFSCSLFLVQVIVTERAGHARDMLSSITNRELNLYDGVVAVVSSCILPLPRIYFPIFMEYGLFCQKTWI